MILLEGLVSCLFCMLHSLLLPFHADLAHPTAQREVPSVGELPGFMVGSNQLGCGLLHSCKRWGSRLENGDVQLLGCTLKRCGHVLNISINI